LTRAADLRRRQSELGQEIRSTRRRMTTEMPRRCTAWMREVALRVLLLSQFNDEAVSQFLSAKHRVETAADVRTWYGALRPDVAAGLLDPGDDAARRQMSEAQRFTQEFRLVAWVKEQNAVKGIAPSASAVLEQAGPGLARGRLQRNRYRWLKRCMNRWGGRRVRLGGGDQLSAGEFREKARHPVALSSVAAVPCFATSIWGPERGPRFGSILNPLSETWLCRRLGPES
jgi:hypothetical protein